MSEQIHDATDNDDGAAAGMFEPIKWPFFRAVWLGSIFTSMGIVIQNVSASWVMTDIADAQMVALVQTASFLPVMLFSIPSGAISDMFDRNLVQIVSLTLSLIATVALTVGALLNALTPWSLLTLCFLIGMGNSLLSPAFQASVRDEVPARVLPQAVALRIASFNVARSIGPSIGGVIVAAAGAAAAFAVSALSYVPLLAFLVRWRSKSPSPKKAQSRLFAMMTSGLSYVFSSRVLIRPIIRVSMFGFAGASILAILPIFVRVNLDGDAQTYGVLLTCFGVGAVLGVLSLHRMALFRREHLMRALLTVVMFGLAGLAWSSNVIVASLVCLVLGATWTMAATVLSIVLQVLAPQWIVGRAISVFQAFFAGGVALGSWFWGLIAQSYGCQWALVVSAGLMLVVTLTGFAFPVSDPQPARPSET